MQTARLTLACVAALLLLLAGAGCGGEQDEDAPRTEAQSVVVGGLVYRAPMFRQLNPRVAPDRALFAQARDADPAKDELLFGAFVQICNETDRRQRVPEGFRVVDAFGESYAPERGMVAGAFALQAGTTLAPGACVPERGGVADQAAVPGAVLVFTLPRGALRDRPLYLVLPSDVAGDRPPPRILLDL